jgi:putative exporter of polyketide antibiotics
MSFESLISFLIRSDWVFLASWIVLLGAAFAAAFPEGPAASRKNAPSEGTSALP